MLRDFHFHTPHLNPTLVPLGGGQYHSLNETMTHSLIIRNYFY